MSTNQDEVMNVFPSGVILAWYAKGGKFPTGWAVCDGANGTPDLRGRFLQGTCDMADVGKRGGSLGLKQINTKGHALAISELPGHNHGQTVRSHEGAEGTKQPLEYSPNFPSGNSNNWSWQGSPTGSTGGNAEHFHKIDNFDITPLYDTVIFIMKL